MTYTKKRIVIEAEVPDGATHYAEHNKKIVWLKCKGECKYSYFFPEISDWWTNWTEWHPSDTTFKPKPIEVIV